jgi:monofunctional biosynthetic peptidoglycan transglycosylase
MVIRTTEQLIDGKDIKIKKDWVSINEMSHYLPVAVIASEDQRFLEHYGFDWEAIKKAYELNKKKTRKGKVLGASTISQQVAKNVFLWPSRSFIRKAFEVYFTVLIEFFWSKERIMEVYLNVIEMGDGIYGSEKACMQYFKKHAKNINQDQAAAIAAILPNPRKYSAVRPSSYVAKRKSWIKRNMNYIGKVNFN